MTQAKTPKGEKKGVGSGRSGRASAQLKRGALRVLFLAHREEIASMLEAGHMQRNIHEEVFPKGPISYSQFTRYVRRFIKKEESHERPQKPETIKPPTAVTAGSQTEKKPEPGKPDDGGVIGQFNYKIDPDTPIR